MLVVIVVVVVVVVAIIIFVVVFVVVFVVFQAVNSDVDVFAVLVFVVFTVDGSGAIFLFSLRIMLLYSTLLML